MPRTAAQQPAPAAPLLPDRSERPGRSERGGAGLCSIGESLLLLARLGEMRRARIAAQAEATGQAQAAQDQAQTPAQESPSPSVEPESHSPQEVLS